MCRQSSAYASALNMAWPRACISGTLQEAFLNDSMSGCFFPCSLIALLCLLFLFFLSPPPPVPGPNGKEAEDSYHLFVPVSMYSWAPSSQLSVVLSHKTYTCSPNTVSEGVGGGMTLGDP